MCGRPSLDLTGQTFGRLRVIGFEGKRNHNSSYWLCECKCGNITTVRSDSLLSGNSQSCGCFAREESARRLYESGGENHWHWMGGITPLNIGIRNCLKNLNWRLSVFQRDAFSCCVCSIGRPLNAHHIKPFAKILEEYHITTLEEAYGCDELWDITNGITLCLKCHQELHKNMRLNNE